MTKNNKYNDIDRFEHMSFCLRHDVKIYFKPVSMTDGVIVINYKGNIKTSVDRYRTDNKKWRAKKLHKHIWSDRIMELYTTQYLKLIKQLKDEHDEKNK